MSQSDYNRIAWAHVHAQPREHGSACVIGTRDGLVALRDAVDRAIESGSATANVMAADGEGYGIEVIRTIRSAMGEPPYLYRIVGEMMAHERENDVRIEKLRKASVKRTGHAA